MIAVFIFDSHAQEMRHSMLLAPCVGTDGPEAACCAKQHLGPRDNMT